MIKKALSLLERIEGREMSLRFYFFTFCFLMSCLSSAAELESVRADLQKGLFPISSSKDLRFDVQDVSYLWPVYKEKELLPAIDLNDPSKDLLPSRVVYKKLQKFLKSGSKIQMMNPMTGKQESPAMDTDTITNASLEDYRVVGFRVDNCGPFAGHAQASTETWASSGANKKLVRGQAQCMPQLRLILQPTMYWEDVALHFVYVFNGKDGRADNLILKAMIRDLAYLKSVNPVLTNGKPLGPQQGLKDPQFQNTVLEFLRHYARPEFLNEIAVLSTNAFDGNSEWLFTSIMIQPGHVDDLTLKPLLAIKGSPLSLGFEAQKTDQSFERPEVGIADPDKGNLETVLKLSNPLLTSNQSVDCLSCHSETRSLIYKSIHNPGEFNQILNSQAQLPSYKNITGFPEAKFLPNDIDGVEGNFRQFGFFGDGPVVTFRTAFESAEVAASLNQLLFAQKPQPSDLGAAGVLRVMDCLITKGADSSCF